MGDSSTAYKYNALSGTQAVTCEAGPGTYWELKSKHRFALATDLKQGDVIYLSCHIAFKSVTSLRRIGFEPVINGQYASCWLENLTGDFDFRPMPISSRLRARASRSRTGDMSGLIIL